MHGMTIVIFVFLAFGIWMFLESLERWFIIRQKEAIPTQQREANFDFVTKTCLLIGIIGFSLVMWQSSYCLFFTYA